VCGTNDVRTWSENGRKRWEVILEVGGVQVEEKEWVRVREEADTR